MSCSADGKPSGEREGTSNLLRVLLVAALDPVTGGGAGGQLTEATTLFHSGLKHHVTLVPFSSTMASVPPPPLLFRVRASVARLVRFIRAVRNVDVVFIFFAAGLSFVEKGLMAVIARAAGRGVVARFGGGGLPAQCERFRLMRMWLRATLNAAHVVSIQGQSWAGYFGQFPEAEGKLVIVPNGIVIPSFASPRRPERNSVAFAGWIDREKGVFEAVEVVKQVRARGIDAVLTMAGDGRDRGRLQSRIEADGLVEHVTILGWRSHEDVLALLRASQVLLFPSHLEGLPNVVLEAMAVGTPVIATRVGSIPDVIVDETTGILTGVGDVPSMVDALARLLSHPFDAKKLADGALITVKGRYCIDNVWPIHHAAITRASQDS